MNARDSVVPWVFNFSRQREAHCTFLFLEGAPDASSVDTCRRPLNEFPPNVSRPIAGSRFFCSYPHRWRPNRLCLVCRGARCTSVL